MDPYGLDIVMVSGGGSSAKPISELQVTDRKPDPYGRALTHAPDHARRISLSAFTVRAFNDRLRRLIDAALVRVDRILSDAREWRSEYRNDFGFIASTTAMADDMW